MRYTNIGLVAYLQALYAQADKTVYILSGIGRVLTEAKIRERIAMGDAGAIRKQAWLRTQIGKTGFDCVGAIKSYRWTKGIPFGAVTYNKSEDHNVRMMWNASPEKATTVKEVHPNIPGLLVMTEDLGHVGVYVGVENGRKTYIECTVTDDAWRLIKSYGYLGRKNVEWTRWAKLSTIEYVTSPTPTPKPDPKPPVTGNIILESGHELVLKVDTWSRNEPDTTKPAGKVKLPKGSVLPYDAYQQINGYDWKRLANGKWIPAGPLSNTTEFASIRPTNKPKPKPKPDPTPSTKFKEGDSVTVNGTPCKNSAGLNPGTALRNYKGKITKVATSGTHRYHVDSKGWIKESDLSGGSTAQITVGSSVVVNGTPRSNSAGAGGGTPLKNFKGTVGIIVQGAKCPYHITGKGWVDANSIGVTSSGPVIAEGNTVTVNGTPCKNSVGLNPGTRLSNFRGRISKVVTTGSHQVHIEGKGWVPRSAIS